MIFWGEGDVFQSGVVALLSSVDGVEIVGEMSGNGPAGCFMRMRADILVIDLDMAGCDVLSMIRRARAKARCAVLAMTASEDVAFAMEALHAGAGGIMLKRSSKAQLLEALRAVSGGGGVLPPMVAHWMVQRLRGNAAGVRAFRASVWAETLTPRQTEILAHIGQGLANTEIADRLQLSLPTIKTHVSALLRALDLRDRTQLAIFAWREGLVTISVPGADDRELERLA
ncbi:response regulator transcription factor [Actinomadura napierensis]|uniref:Response regulator transcription factor n=1 Tax=Actinomadura napierensis TaxID=267854 RepID=A0ABN2ZY21_9ACTN